MSLSQRKRDFQYQMDILTQDMQDKKNATRVESIEQELEFKQQLLIAEENDLLLQRQNYEEALSTHYAFLQPLRQEINDKEIFYQKEVKKYLSYLIDSDAIDVLFPFQKNKSFSKKFIDGSHGSAIPFKLK